MAGKDLKTIMGDRPSGWQINKKDLIAMRGKPSTRKIVNKYLEQPAGDPENSLMSFA